MQLNVRGKNLEISDSIRTLVDDKLGKLDRYFEGLTDIDVELGHEKARNAQERSRVDVSLFADGSLIFRAEARGADIRSALDTVADVVQRQITRRKERLQDRGRVSAAKTAAALVAAEMGAESPSESDEEGNLPIDVEEIEVRPLGVEEAYEEMNQSQLGWLLFTDADSGQVNLLMKDSSGRTILYVPAPK